MEILENHKEQFGTDFTENKKILENISIVRSKELKNELAGFITKFIKREIRDQKAKEEQIAEESKITTEDSLEITQDSAPSETVSEPITAETKLDDSSQETT